MVDITGACFKSNTDEWGTPQDFYDRLNAIYKFTLDPCATKENAKCEKYFTIEDDGLKQSWADNSVFVNPPYSQCYEWIEKSYNEAQKFNTFVLCLIPSRTDTKYFHKFIMKAHKIIFIDGRLKFGNSKTSAPFPSMVVCFNKRFDDRQPIIESMSVRKKSA